MGEGVTAKTRPRTESEKEGARGTKIIKKYKSQYTVPAHTTAECVSSRWQL
jgi:hypothetical protein